MFGLVDTSKTPALGYMEVASQRDAVTLLPSSETTLLQEQLYTLMNGLHIEGCRAYRMLQDMAW